MLAGFPPRKEIQCPVYFPWELQAPRSKVAIRPDSGTGDSSDVQAWGSMPSWIVVSSAATHERRAELLLSALEHCRKCLWDPLGLTSYSQSHD